MSLLLSSPNLHTYRDATLVKAPKCIWPNNGLKLSNSSVFKRIADFLGISLNLSSTSTQSIMERELLLKGKSSGKSSDLIWSLPSNQFDWFSRDCCFVSACFSYCANACVANQKVTSENAQGLSISFPWDGETSIFEPMTLCQNQLNVIVVIELVSMSQCFASSRINHTGTSLVIFGTRDTQKNPPLLLRWRRSRFLRVFWKETNKSRDVLSSQG